MNDTFPHVRVTGDPRERGRAYGEQARSRIARSIEAYREVFRAYAGWEWDQVRREAARFEAPIAAFDERYVQEIGGIADGAGVDLEDVLAINVRTEVMFAAKARAARRGGDGQRQGECSAFAVLPEASADGHTLVGQNWDWLLHSFDTVVVLESEQNDGPNFVSVVEAGLLAKTGMNSSGLGVVTNALVTDDDRGEPGVPYHVLLRAFMDCENLSDALAAAQRGVRSSSANYLIAHRDGIAVNIEATPGDYSRLFLAFPEQGVLLHTNHFVSNAFDRRDVSLWVMPDSPIRLERLRSAVGIARAGALSLDTFRAALADHANYPSGICCHPDGRMEPLDQGATVASVLMDLDARRMWVADGHPCTSPYRQLDVGGLLAKPSPVTEGMPA
ncbi:MAG TPA: C45 family peptidase [Actinomycetota bacterium]|jgi:isopenicillin-N N-acyltransferase-like protein|nr:C45 family peptidase [Actinomycetota bacterium]